MSHIVKIQTQLRDAHAVSAACQRLKLGEPISGTAKLFSGEATGLIVQFPDWQYPIVIDTNDGNVQFDNFNGHWGGPQQLDQFMQAYAVEKAKLEARKKGHLVTEQALSDGSIKLSIQVA